VFLLQSRLRDKDGGIKRTQGIFLHVADDPHQTASGAERQKNK